MSEEVRIESVGRQGDGLADTSSGRVHVAYTLPGEHVMIAREGERGTLETVVEPSAERIAPVCRHFGVCGGCALQHWQSEPYLAWKRDLVVDALAREGVRVEVAQAIPAHGAGRTRAVFHAGRGDKKDALGFAKRRSHEIVAIEECPVLDPKLEAALPIARELARILLAAGKPIDLHFTLAERGLDIDIRGPGKLAKPIESKLVSFAAEKKLSRVSLHGAPLAQLLPPTHLVGNVRVTVPPGPFLQATAEGERVLAEKVLEAALGTKSAADLFCGIGTFALRLAANTKVAAFDNHEPSVAALQAASKAPGLKPVTASARDLFRWPLVADELKKIDFVVLDPPRQGAEAQARELAKSKVKKIAYVSCDADSFARDAKILIGGGYKPGAVTPVDQFRYSPHVELVGVFAR
ncbi:MAG: class I SAM-dependent RNA methyltransferase [Xanthobacteraceae bacterium]|nr:class I SAM-dependent RNA methyltransferase [Xanthobacteraceae bacterium]MBX3521665.1 class I SAM-dependent RNA methyltransferase [Xanthobacteraceae bacterium]MCW5673923.1 class I SAM-dependent RNA methyltransferase [Xanthobacteraceae bacterium]